MALIPTGAEAGYKYFANHSLYGTYVEFNRVDDKGEVVEEHIIIFYPQKYIYKDKNKYNPKECFKKGNK